jgi:hypothetical protein
VKNSLLIRQPEIPSGFYRSTAAAAAVVVVWCAGDSVSATATNGRAYQWALSGEIGAVWGAARRAPQPGQPWPCEVNLANAAILLRLALGGGSAGSHEERQGPSKSEAIPRAES